MTAPAPSAIVQRLKTVNLFRGLTEPELERLAGLWKRVEAKAGEKIIAEGQRGDSFYIIDQGQVDVSTFAGRSRGASSRGSRAETRVLRVMGPGDYFGEVALLTGSRRTATVTARTSLALLRVDAAGFERLLRLAPTVKPRLVLTARTYEFIRGQRLDWLDRDEAVLLFVKKHWYLLFQRILVPLGSLAVLAVLLAGLFLISQALAEVLLPAFGVVASALVVWLVLLYIDWGNDYSVVTNRRVLHEERVLLVYEARIEAPLYSLRSAAVKISPAGNVLRFGDVVLRTFAGAVTFLGVPEPQVVADLALDLVEREKRRQTDVEREAIRAELLKQMGYPAETGPAASATRTRTQPRLLGAALQGAFQQLNLQTRVEEEGVITYRKHPWVLLTQAAAPILILSALTLLTAVRIAGWLGFVPLNLLTCGLEFMLALPFMGWLIYRYEDWRNDIYQVTNDSIIDIERKPFLGREERRQAPLEAVLNVEVKRPSMMAILLNFGDVIVQTGGATGEMTFNSVFEPLSIQQDIWRQFDALQTRAREADAARRRAEMGRWFAEYHRILKDHSAGQPG